MSANKLQWTLASVPLIKALQLTLSFLFWYVLLSSSNAFATGLGILLQPEENCRFVYYGT
ncbi:hypothetical protein CsSME_00007596 [Camellia sinensis var. sinensis]